MQIGRHGGIIGDEAAGAEQRSEFGQQIHGSSVGAARDTALAIAGKTSALSRPGCSIAPRAVLRPGAAGR